LRKTNKTAHVNVDCTLPYTLATNRERHMSVKMAYGNIAGRPVP
jgi:hypothetical protein